MGSIPDDKNPSVPFVSCGHRFCRECILASTGELPNCLLAECGGRTYDNSFKVDQELVNRIIKKSCFVSDSEAASKNGVITDDVVGSRSTNKLLTSG